MPDHGDVEDDASDEDNSDRDNDDNDVDDDDGDDDHGESCFFIRKHVEMSSGLYNASSRSIPFSFKCFPRACSVLPAACQTRPPCGCPKVVAEGEASAPSFVHRG